MNEMMMKIASFMQKGNRNHFQSNDLPHIFTEQSPESSRKLLRCLPLKKDKVSGTYSFENSLVQAYYEG